LKHTATETEVCPHPFGPKQTMTLLEIPYGPLVFGLRTNKLSGISIRLFRLYAKTYGFQPLIKFGSINFKRYFPDNNTFVGGTFEEVPYVAGLSMPKMSAHF
jgi:hypothetical protein